MHEYTLLFIVSSLLFIWLILLSILFTQMYKHYKQLVGKSKEHDLVQLLENIIKNEKRLTQENAQIKHLFEQLKQKTSLHIQKVGFVRFNPFDETGGDQSFALALLDDTKSGMVLTFLHSRDTTRVYAKRIKKAKSEQFPLSKEEEYVIASAS